MNSTVEALQNTVCDEGLHLAARKESARMYVAMLLEAIPEPTHDDPDVAKLSNPPALIDDELMDRLLLLAWRHMNHLRGWRENGGTQVQIREHVTSQRRGTLLGTLAEDTAHHDLVRAEAAAQRRAMPWAFPNLAQPVQRGR